MGAGLLQALGGEAGCYRLSAAFYERVGVDPALRPLFPGKSLRCATEAFGSFLVQLLGGDEEQAQHRWYAGLRESHARFRIGEAERVAWLRNMDAALEATVADGGARAALREFFVGSSGFVTGRAFDGPADVELAARWRSQVGVEEFVDAVAGGQEEKALALAASIDSGRAGYVGVLARMMQSGLPALTRFVEAAVAADPALAGRRHFGKRLLHYAAGAGCVPVVAALLAAGADPNMEDGGGHSPLYCVANECGSEAGPQVVRMLVAAGADVRAREGVTGATALHMAARRGHVEIARTLLALGADARARDRKGVTPLDRAVNCRKENVAALLRGR